MSLSHGDNLEHGGSVNGEAKSFAQALRDFFGGIKDGWGAYARYHELSALTRSELAARGLTRADIARAAMFPGRPGPAKAANVSGVPAATQERRAA